MQRIFRIGCWLAIVVAIGRVAVCEAQPPELPRPAKEHNLLGQFAGQWEMVAETVPAPGAEAVKCQGTESAQLVGGFWLVSRSEAQMAGTAVTNLMTLGYDPATKKYVGTFVCSMDSTLWTYEGSMDAEGKKLTLLTEGPSPLDPAQTAKYRETLELDGPDRKVFTSYMQTEDGDWLKIVTMEYRRKK